MGIQGKAKISQVLPKLRLQLAVEKGGKGRRHMCGKVRLGKVGAELVAKKLGSAFSPRSPRGRITSAAASPRASATTSRAGGPLLAHHLLLFALLPILFLPVAYAQTLYVDASYAGNFSNGSLEYPYTTITQAIADANAGDLIIIQSGTYNESLVITKPLTLKGNGSVTIHGNNTDYIAGYYGCNVLILPSDVERYNVSLRGNVIEIVNTSNVTLENLNINHSRLYRHDSGVWIKNASNITLINLNISDTCDGVYTEDVTNLTVRNVNADDVGYWRGYGRNPEESTLLQRTGFSLFALGVNSSEIVDFRGDLVLGGTPVEHKPVKAIKVLRAIAKGFYNNLWLRGEDIEVRDSVFSGAKNLDIFATNVKNHLFSNITFSTRVDVNGVKSLDIRRFNATAGLPSLDLTIDLYNLTGTIEGNQSCVRFYYDEAVNNQLSLLGITEANITLYYLNESTNEWEPINATVNTSVNYVEACLTHFSTYALGYIAPASQREPAPTPQPVTTGGGGGGGGSWTPPKPYLSLYPKHFKYITYIVYGENASYEDKKVALKIAEFLGLSDRYVKKDSELKSYDRDKNLILVGGMVANAIVKELNDEGLLTYRYKNIDGAMLWGYSHNGTTYDNQGAYVIEVLKNPYTSYRSRFIMVVAGLTREGTQKAGELLTDPRLKPKDVWLKPERVLPDKSALASWEGGTN